MHAVSGATGAARVEVRTIRGRRDPVELFEAVAQRDLPVLLHSAQPLADANRYSVVAADPFLVLRWQKGRGTLRSRVREEVFDGDPLPLLRSALERHRVEPVPNLPFVGGAVGYLGYGLREFTGANRKGPTLPSPWPDLHLAFYDQAMVIDHSAGCTHLLASGARETAPARRREQRRLDLERLQRAFDARAGREAALPDAHPGAPRFRTPPADYLMKIRLAQEYLAAGEIYQVNLSHRIEVEGDWEPLALYRRLVERHPAAFAAYLPLRECTVLCASPERFARLSGRRAETWPIKGTRARGAGPLADAASAEILRSGAKERSENVMIVDLSRNDLGRVCVPGSVRVDDLCRVETLPSVHHLVSRIAGTLREEADGIDLVRALFPGGSMTGAPKIRAMEIIDELEGVERGIYSGSVGYFSLDGGLDLNIVIRTLLIAGRRAELQVGGAILAESDPEAEYQETLDKARPLLQLLEGSGEAVMEEPRHE